MPEHGPAAAIADRVAIIILAAVAVTAAFTFRDYGLGWDDFTQAQYGDLLLKLYGSGFADKRALSFVNLYKYGGGFDMAATLAAKVLPFGLFETRRLVGAAVGLIGLAVTWRLTRRLGGSLAGLGALALLATCPLYYGHMLINAKDAPFAVAMIALLYGIVRVVDDYPQPKPRSLLAFGIGLGAAFGTRVLAGVAAPYAVLGLLMIVVTEAREQNLRAAAARFGGFVLRLLPAFVLAYLIMGLFWPWSVLSPLNPLWAAEYFGTFFEVPWRELYDGALIPVPAMPATYLPHLFALKLPLVMLALGLAGFVVTVIAVLRGDAPLPRRASLAITALAPILPILVAMAMRPALYNGLRHFVFIAPPFAVLGGFGLAWIAQRVRSYGTPLRAACAALFAGGLALPIVGMARLHPYEYVYFNEAIGGARGADGKFMLDYWGLAFKQAAQALRAKLAATHERPPAGRRWVVETCGPQPAAEVELGPQFETTWVEKKPDFAMSLGTFYCRKLDAPLVAEVKRDGIVFARVWDLRGLPAPNLLNPPAR